MLERVQQVFRKVFDDKALIITSQTSADTIEQWDSLVHIELIAAIEEEFKINFSFNEVVKFNDVGDMIDLIQNKLKE